MQRLLLLCFGVVTCSCPIPILSPRNGSRMKNLLHHKMRAIRWTSWSRILSAKRMRLLHRSYSSQGAERYIFASAVVGFHD
jgi:hypothetical protein